MQRNPIDPCPSRSAPSAGSEIRPGVAVAAVALFSLALGVAAVSLTRSRDEAPEASTQPRIAALESSDLAPLPLPSRTVSLRRESKTTRHATTASQPTSSSPAEPEWDGKGLPSREWLRWQLATVVEQAHPEGSISSNALEAAIDDALALRAAKLELESTKDPATLTEAQARYERAAQDLAANVGIEGIDFTAF